MRSCVHGTATMTPYSRHAGNMCLSTLLSASSSHDFIVSVRAVWIQFGLLAVHIMAEIPSTSTIDHIVFLSPPGTLGETRKKFISHGFE
jgi:hypothetical protein